MLTIPTDEEIKAELSVIDIPSLSLAKDLLNKNKPQMAYAVLTQVL